MYKIALAMGACGLLAACATNPTATSVANTSLITLESADTAALAGLIIYEKAANPSSAVIAQVKSYQMKFDVAVAPLEAAAESGGDVSNAAEMEAATAALAALTTYETNHNINSGG